MPYNAPELPQSASRLEISQQRVLGDCSLLTREELENLVGHPVLYGEDGHPQFDADDKIIVRTIVQARTLLADNHHHMPSVKPQVLALFEAATKAGVTRKVLRRALDREYRRLGKQRREVQNLRDGMLRSRNALQEVHDWLKKPIVLERPDGSAFHKMQESFEEGTMMVPSVDKSVALEGLSHATLARMVEYRCFVIEHDWAAAFKGASEFDGGDVHLPFEQTCFEFRISGRPVCALFDTDSDGVRCIPAVYTSHGWIAPWSYTFDGARLIGRNLKYRGAELEFEEGGAIINATFVDLIAQQVRAVSISLEAEVAETTVVRAPHKLNHSREKRGKLPLVDYHVVSLAHRRRAPSLPRDPSAEPGTRKRLHFRRGHWRHYAEHKTWIKWQLVGNPELGFIDKMYRL